MITNLYKQKNSVFLIIFYFLVIIFTFNSIDDHGVHIEEKYHRLNGHYWLNYVAQIFNLSDLTTATELKIKSISDYTLSPVSYYNKYGVIFDLPMAFFEIIFKKENTFQIYYFKHLFSFLIFIFSSLFFFKILIQRYKNFFISFAGLILYMTTPRIFGDSFLYKDVLYLSFFTITLYFFLKSIDKFDYKNLLFFSFFSAVSFSLKIFTIFIPVIFFITILIKNFYTKKIYFYLRKFAFYQIFFFLFSFILWPYLWENSFINFIELFTSMKNDLINVKVLFNSNYIQNSLLPDTYLIKWIFISTPILQSFFFIFGFLFYSKRLFKRFITINENSIHNDIWRGKGEEKDFIFFLVFFSYFFIFLLSNAPFYNGWRLVYFFHFFLIYFSINFLNNFFIFFRENQIIKKFAVSIIIIAIILNVYSLVKYHPYQSIYFNNLFSAKTINGFEGDYYGLSTKHFFLKVLEKDNKQNIKIAVASHTPIQRGLESLTEDLHKRFDIIGQEYQNADYIYKNNISEINPELNKKYEVPKNFSKIYELKINKLIIYEMYKRGELK